MSNGLVYEGDWGSTYCYPKEHGGWKDTYTVAQSRPRTGNRGDLVSISTYYSIDMSFASKGTDLSDISERYSIQFGFPHNELFEAAVANKLDEVKRLVEKDNKCINNAINIGSEWTALHGAVVYNQLEVVEYLIKAGASYKIKDKNGNSPLTMAAILKFNECVELMKKLINDPSYMEQHAQEMKDEEARKKKDYDSCANYINGNV